MLSDFYKWKERYKCNSIHTVRYRLRSHKGNMKQRTMHLHNPKLVHLYSYAVLNKLEDKAIKSIL